MCGRYTLTSKFDDLQGRFNFEGGTQQYRPRYNTAPTQPVLTVVDDHGEYRAEFMRWGLIPSWAKDPTIGTRMINARAETLAEKPSFRSALRKRRCLVLADGFYEWRREGYKSSPTYVALKSRKPFGMAGLWETWRAPSGDLIHSCTIVTTTANRLMEPIHNRMPVILPEDAEAAWLDGGIDDPGTLTELLTPYGESDMVAYEVSKLVNSPANDTSDCLKPLEQLL